MFLIAYTCIVLCICVTGHNGLQHIPGTIVSEFKNATLKTEDTCESYHCHNGGDCLFIKEHPVCVCKEGYYGLHCEEGTEDPCEYYPCHNDGFCFVSGGHPKCICQNVYYGIHCEEECDCGSNGICRFENEQKMCNCNSGFVYMDGTCKDPCITMACQNGGICKQESSSFICHCKPPYSGSFCEKDPCTDSPCQNGGTCVENGYSFKCLCRYPYSGDTCQYDACYDNPCFNGATCRKEGDSFKCKCPYGYIGNVCEKEGYESTIDEEYHKSTHELTEFTQNFNSTTIRPGICTRDTDCMNGGVCKDGHCECPPNFGGYWCDRSFLCESLKATCRAMGATCKVIGLNAICDCPQDKMYHPKSGMCEDICDPWKCLHGRCEIDGRTYKCICDSGYKGEHCNESVETKTEQSYVWFYVMTSLMVLICLLLIGQMYLSRRSRKFNTKTSDDIEMKNTSSRTTTSFV